MPEITRNKDATDRDGRCREIERKRQTASRVDGVSWTKQQFCKSIGFKSVRAETSAEILKKKMGRKEKERKEEKERTHNDNAKIYHRWYFISDEFYGRVGFDRAPRDMRRKGRDEMLIYTRH